MILNRNKLLMAGVCLAVTGITLRLFRLDLSDLVLGIGLLIILSAAFLFTYKKKKRIKDDGQ